jgi:exonuclease III
MEKLTQFIQQNLSSFNSDDPPDGHFERFRQKLEMRKKGRRVNLPLVASAAAVACIVITGTLGVLYHNPSILKFNQDRVSYQAFPPDLLEVETYYSAIIEAKYQEVSILSRGTNSTLEQEAKRQLADLLLGYHTLKEDLLQSPKQDRIIDAIIQNYKVQIDVLEKLCSSMREERGRSDFNDL